MYFAPLTTSVGSHIFELMLGLKTRISCPASSNFGALTSRIMDKLSERTAGHHGNMQGNWIRLLPMQTEESQPVELPQMTER